MTEVQLIDINPKNVFDYGQCGYKNLKHHGYRLKLDWLIDRMSEGYRNKILNSQADGAIGGIEYAPGESIWRGIDADNYMVIQCLYIIKKPYKEHGYGKMMINACEDDARKSGFKGVAALTRKGTWMSGSKVFYACGYREAACAKPDYSLLVKKFDENTDNPTFRSDYDEKLKSYSNGLIIITSAQCPFVGKAVPEIKALAKEQFGMQADVITLKTAREAQNSPTPYGSFCILYRNQILIDAPCSKTKFRNDLSRFIGRR